MLKINKLIFSYLYHEPILTIILYVGILSYKLIKIICDKIIAMFLAKNINHQVIYEL